MGGQQMVSILDNFQYSLKVTYRKNAIWLFSITIIPVPTREEKCPVWAQVENKYIRDCNKQSKIQICFVTSFM